MYRSIALWSCVFIAVSLLAVGCSTNNGGGDAGGGGGEADCSGNSATTASGSFSVITPSTTLNDLNFDQVVASFRHKVDIDAADQCFAGLEVVLSTTFEDQSGCRMVLEGSTVSADDPSRIVLTGQFEADSFCEGFEDADEGTYSGPAGWASIEGLSFLGAGADVCATSTIQIELSGALTHASDTSKTVDLQSVNFAVQGDIASSGSTDETCLGVELTTEPDPVGCAPECDNRDCGPDGCGGTCGSCDSGDVCSAAQTCLAAADCTDTCTTAGAACASICGTDCGTCQAGEICDDFQCVCAPSC
ncbi:MAG: hypothetical protein QF464_16490, partial [Myxococcota bacterium]|nr:hypothetical protein [Myxococcota bacterium]